MVSKVTAIALVAIIAIPILAGFALNFQDVAETRYVPGDVKTNVTPLLYNATTYDVVSANSYELNADNFTRNITGQMGENDLSYYVPNYNSYTLSDSSLPYSRTILTGVAPSSVYVGDYYVYEIININKTPGLSVTVSGSGITTTTYNNISYLSYSNTYGFVAIDYNYNIPTYHTATLTFSVSDSFVSNAGELYLIQNPKNGSLSNYANLSEGYTLRGTTLEDWLSPSLAYNVLMSVDFSAITSNLTGEFAYRDYSLRFYIIDQYNYENNTAINNANLHYIRVDFNRATPADELVVSVKAANNPWLNITEDIVLYRESGKDTYQISFTSTGVQFYYIGGWQKTIGVANYFRSYSVDWETPFTDGNLIRGFRYDGFNGLTFNTGMAPTFRFDAATVRSSEYQIIRDKIYDPSQLTGSNTHQTEISNVSRYGSAIEFGGTTYNVTNRSITLGSRLTLSVNGLTFDSIPAGDGYDNRINGYVVSRTSTPSTITFDGSWLADINTTLLKSETYSENKWVPGHFAWDGLDDNFLIAGLLTSVGAFILLAMYGRRSGAKVLPLLLVCGGAAFMFLLML